MSWLLERIQATPPHAVPLELPARYREASLSHIPREDCVGLAKDYVLQFYEAGAEGKAPLLVGRSGTWKTYTACAIARMLYELPLDVRFVSCAVTLPHIQRNLYEESGMELLRKIRRTALVVMDDFTMVPSSSKAHELLLEIAEYRFSNQLPTIWTGNVSGSTLQEIMGNIAGSYGPGFARRLHHGSEGFRLRLG